MPIIPSSKVTRRIAVAVRHLAVASSSALAVM
jgi:hypothetical protein